MIACGNTKSLYQSRIVEYLESIISQTFLFGGIVHSVFTSAISRPQMST